MPEGLRKTPHCCAASPAAPCSPSLLDQPDEALEAQVREDLEALLGISGTPTLCRTTRYPDCMPQYNVGHLDRVERIDTRLKQFPTLALAGKSYGGVGIADCIAGGEAAADGIVEGLAEGLAQGE